MYLIELQNYGYKLTFSLYIDLEEMKKWVEDARKALENAPKEFGVLVDMRTLTPLPPDSQEHMQEGQKLFKEKGMVRSVVVLANSITKMQFKRLAQASGIYEWER